jgi:ribosome biogenesis GTPase
MLYRLISGNKRVFKALGMEDGHEVLVTPRKTLLYNFGPLFIGDIVEIDKEDTIVKAQERKNLLIRPRVANLDYAIVVASTFEPEFSSYLLDKFLCYLNFCRIPAIVVFTKIDKLNAEDFKKIEAYRNYYESIGFASFMTDKYNPETVQPIKELIKGKTIAFMGQTGAGKSSLINTIDEEFNRSIGEYSKALGRGKHKTKEVIFFKYQGGLIGDTPGFSSLEFSLLNINAQDLSRIYPGYEKYALKCYYNDCMHISEKDCKVIEAIKENKISKEGYVNYQKMLKEIKEGKRNG